MVDGARNGRVTCFRAALFRNTGKPGHRLQVNSFALKEIHQRQRSNHSQKYIPNLDLNRGLRWENHQGFGTMRVLLAKVLPNAYELPIHSRYRTLDACPLSSARGHICSRASGAFLVSQRVFHTVETVAGRRGTVIYGSDQAIHSLSGSPTRRLDIT